MTNSDTIFTIHIYFPETTMTDPQQPWTCPQVKARFYAIIGNSHQNKEQQDMVSAYFRDNVEHQEKFAPSLLEIEYIKKQYSTYGKDGPIYFYDMFRVCV